LRFDAEIKEFNKFYDNASQAKLRYAWKRFWWPLCGRKYEKVFKVLLYGLATTRVSKALCDNRHLWNRKKW